MSDAVAIALGAATPLGEGERALPIGGIGERARVAITDDATLRASGLARCAAARVAGERGPDAATELLFVALDACAARLDVASPRWRERRVGFVVGSSSGAMASAELAYQALAEGRAPSIAAARGLAYADPFLAARARLGLPLAREAHVLAACASSTIALGLAHAWLEDDTCDVVLAGGYDALTLFVAAGFSALLAVTASKPRPFTLERDGLALSEGAAIVALVRARDVPIAVAPLAVIAGFAMTTDAVHLTAPDREGASLSAAITVALERARVAPAEVGAIGAHATATPYNDGSEARAFARALPAGVAVHAPKAAVGHLLGAAGVVETMALARGLTDRVALPSAGEGTADPDAPARLTRVGTPSDASVAVKTSLAFGGVNAVLVLREGARVDEAPQSARRTPRVCATSASELAGSLDELATRAGVRVERLARLDPLSLVVVDAIAELAREVGRERIARAALVVGHDVATVATNATYWSRIAARGARFAEPRRFPYTSPNACAGEAALLFGIRGPTLAVGGAPGLASQAVDVARDLLAAGLVDEAIAVEATEASPAATALLAAFDEPPRPTHALARLLSA